MFQWFIRFSEFTKFNESSAPFGKNSNEHTSESFQTNVGLQEPIFCHKRSMMYVEIHMYLLSCFYGSSFGGHYSVIVFYL